MGAAPLRFQILGLLLTSHFAEQAAIFLELVVSLRLEECWIGEVFFLSAEFVVGSVEPHLENYSCINLDLTITENWQTQNGD